MALFIALALFITLPAVIWLVVNFNMRRLRRKFAKTKEGKQLLKLRARHKIELAFNTYSVSPITDDTWIVRQENDFNVMHYVVTDDLKLLAKTNINGIIRPLSSGGQLLIEVREGGTQTKSGFRGGRLVYGVMDANFIIKIKVIFERIAPLQRGFIQVTREDLHGVYTSDYSLIIPIEFESILQDDANERFIARKAGKYYLYDYKGLIIQQLAYTSLYLNHINNQTRIKAFVAGDEQSRDDDQLIKGKWGLLDSNYQETIPVKYDLLYNGPNAVLVMDGALCIDDTVIPWPGMEKYYHATGGKWGVRSFTDEMLIPLAYDWIDFTVSDNYFFINNNGQMCYVRMPYEAGFWGVQGGKWGLINLKNEIVIPADYDVMSLKDNQVFFQKTDAKLFDESLPFTVFELPFQNVNSQSNQTIAN